MTIIESLTDKKLPELLNNGAVGVMPTDTVYGLVCLASNKESVLRLYKLKNREGQKPGTVIAASIDQLIGLGVTRRYLTAVEQFWPNPISILIPVSDQLHYLTQNQPALALRVVADKKLAKLIEQVGPLLTSSANKTTKPPANNVNEAQKYFGNMVDFYVDGGDLSDKKPSTIIRVIDDAIELVRPGAIDIDENGKILS